ncbi:uncharacterized protein TNIN_310871 [Trichonephila inaurata madagascariensis]|uniref:Gustatory receptor n=1 Tax=Trichonephila inaurata madagascariensis TaxID=2747483 RepID=A0A8X7C566_9ARAC|nr:uncharacterized protein TNIN_310871 [Trichonephila inaurata madagascariensis]
MNNQMNSLEKSFLPILFLFNLTGLEYLPSHGVFKQNRFCSFISEFLKYLFRFLQCLGIIAQIFSVILLEEKKVPVSVFILVTLQIAVNIQTCRSREQIRVILMKLWKCSQMLHCYQNGQKLRASISAFIVFLILLNIIYISTYFYSNEYAVYRSLIQNSHAFYNLPKLKQYTIHIPEVCIIANPTAAALVFSSLAGYYGFVCLYVKDLFNRIENGIIHLGKDFSHLPLIQSYIELAGLMKSMDDYLSFSAFIIVLSSLAGLFYINFGILIFSIDGCVHPLTGETYFFSLVCMVILSASAANRAFLTAKEALLSLPAKIPQHYDELKIIVCRECMKDVSLTLWKVYKIEPSLLLSAMGLLITYGMLLATLGGTISQQRDSLLVD